jgi:hypothetical protein
LGIAAANVLEAEDKLNKLRNKRCSDNRMLKKSLEQKGTLLEADTTLSKAARATVMQRDAQVAILEAKLDYFEKIEPNGHNGLCKVDTTMLDSATELQLQKITAKNVKLEQKLAALEKQVSEVNPKTLPQDTNADLQDVSTKLERLEKKLIEVEGRLREKSEENDKLLAEAMVNTCDEQGFEDEAIKLHDSVQTTKAKLATVQKCNDQLRSDNVKLESRWQNFTALLQKSAVFSGTPIPAGSALSPTPVPTHAFNSLHRTNSVQLTRMSTPTSGIDIAKALTSQQLTPATVLSPSPSRKTDQIASPPKLVGPQASPQSTSDMTSAAPTFAPRIPARKRVTFDVSDAPPPAPKRDLNYWYDRPCDTYVPEYDNEEQDVWGRDPKRRKVEVSSVKETPYH